MIRNYESFLEQFFRMANTHTPPYPYSDIGEGICSHFSMVYPEDEPSIHIWNYFTVDMAILCVNHYW